MSEANRIPIAETVEPPPAGTPNTTIPRDLNSPGSFDVHFQAEPPFSLIYHYFILGLQQAALPNAMEPYSFTYVPNYIRTVQLPRTLVLIIRAARKHQFPQEFKVHILWQLQQLGFDPTVVGLASRHLNQPVNTRTVCST